MERDKSREQSYEEWLGRLDIPLDQQADIETFQTYLAAEFGITGLNQVGALWDSTGMQATMGELGIRGVTVEYPWGKERRYAIQGLPGLWGWDAVRQIMEAEE